MKKHLILKLLAVNLTVIAFVMVIVWLSIDTLAAGYFVTLMEKYNISPGPAHKMFVGAVHRYLIWACLAAAIITVLLSFIMMRKVLTPLTRMTAISGQIAAGNFNVRVPVDTEDEVGRLALAFNQMSESLEKIEKLRRTLMIDVAHELRTPLTNIRGYLEALTDKVLPPSKETFSLLEDETIRLAQLVEDVLQLAKADSSHGNLEIEPVDIRKMVDNAIEHFSRIFSQKSISVEVQADEGPIEIPADKKNLARVLRNLTDNAARYTPVNGNILIRLDSSLKYVRVSYFNDYGDLVPEDLPYIFERFYRGEKSRSRQHGGAGIGLAIVKELVEAHGGSIGAEFDAGRIRIWFELPVHTS
ncbi:sensor histidine kinase [Thermodesulfobacteriota bacterium]